MLNLYAVLGIERAATPQQIKAAYRGKAREAHPDRGGTAARFAEIQRAYEVLSVPEERQRWEASYQAWASARRAVLCGQCFAALRTKAGGRNRCPMCGADVVTQSPTRLDRLRDDLIDRSADFLIHVGDRVGQEIASATEQAVSRGLQALQTRLGRGR
jgi:hypothetical protein